ncbi:MAG: hypothetical protein K6F32_07600 [Bacilli bacterium]|nr:hypothetical protein [Bacilli bacterium]
MKCILNLYLAINDHTFELLHHIREAGFNGTIINTVSLKHEIEGTEEDEIQVLTLHAIEKRHITESLTCRFVTDDDKMEELKDIIREYTGNFTLVHGGMYSRSLPDYEGTF